MADFNPTRGDQSDWLTPPELIQALGTFDLDPCSPIVRRWDTARKHLTILDDGLATEWEGRVWLNPPYGRQTFRWLEKMRLHNNGIALTFARTDTKTFHDYIFPFATSMLFIRSRINFYNLSGSKTDRGNAPSLLIAYGAKNDEILRNSNIDGRYIFLNYPH